MTKRPQKPPVSKSTSSTATSEPSATVRGLKVAIGRPAKRRAGSNTYGADTAKVVTPQLVEKATGKLGTAPQFWGRYFKGPGNQDGVQYQRPLEAEVFRQNNIRVAPIARQTPSVGGSQAEGWQDGLKNGAAVLAAFGPKYLSSMMEGVLVFLDVEPDYPMSEAYYVGWAEGLVAAGGIAMSSDTMMSIPQVNFLPCVYMKPSADPASLRALLGAVDAGVPCGGLWITRQYVTG